MPKLIAISKVGKYAQGEITSEMLLEMVNSYDRNFQGAPFIDAHRKFNAKGEMEINPRALGWISTLSTDGTFLYALIEEEHDLKWYFDGISYRYASIEIEVVQKEEKEVLYCAAVAITNFPAAKLPIIELNKHKKINSTFNKTVTGSRLIAAYNKISITKNDEEEMKELLIQLCKNLGLPEDSSQKVVIAKLTEMKADLAGKDQLKQFATQFDGIIAALTATPVVTAPVADDPITKLNAKVDLLIAQLTASANTDLSTVIDSEITAGKFLPAQRDLLLAQYENNVAGFKAFAAVSPKLQLNSVVVVPKTEGGNPITYNDLLANTQLFEDTKKDNLALFNQLHAEWLKNPSTQKKED